MKIKIPIRKVEFVWHIAIFHLIMGAFIVLWRQSVRGEVDPSIGDPFLRFLLLGAYLISLSLLVLNPRKAISLILQTKWIWLLMFWIFLSSLWSVSPEISLRKATSILLATLYAFVLIIRYPYKEILKLISIVFTISCIFSWIYVIFIPNLGIMSEPHVGAWRGVFQHKNNLGMVSTLSIIIFVIQFLNYQSAKKYFFIILSIFSVLLVIYSESTTALVLLAVMIMSAVLMIIAKKTGKSWPIFLLISGIIISFAVIISIQNYKDILLLFGKNETLTGRIPLWEYLMSIVLKKPLTGYGYSGFWLGWIGPSAEVWELFKWLPSHSHNGYINLLLEIGLFGLTLVLIVLFRLIYKSFRFFYLENNQEFANFYLLIFLVSIFLLIYNTVETVFLESEVIKALYWVLTVYFYLHLSTTKNLENKENTINHIG